MSEEFTIKQGDTAPALRATLKDPAGTAVDLTGASVVFNLRSYDGRVLVSRGSVTVITAGSGVVEYAWQSGDTAVSGVHDGEFEVTYSDSTVETFPNGDFIVVKVLRQIA